MKKKNLLNFRNRGYEKIDKVFSENEILQINISLFDNIQILLKKKIYKKFSINNLQKLIVYIYFKKPKIFSKFYDLCQNYIGLYQLCTNKKLIDIVSKLLKVNKSSLLVGDLTLRLDNPGKSTAALNFHQESTYYPEIKNYDKSILIWLPLHDVEENGGGLAVCNKFFSKKYKTKWTKGQPRLNKNSKILKQLKADFIFEGKLGSILACNFNSFHASTINKSQNFRLSCALRFYSSESNDFKPFRKFRKSMVELYS